MELVLNLPESRDRLLASTESPVGQRNAFWFTAACCFIAVVSAYDGYLAWLYSVVLYQVELNPIARWIIKYSGNDVAPFLCLKAAGTMIVLVVLQFLHWAAPRLAYPVIKSVAAFQLALLAFLHGA